MKKNLFFHRIARGEALQIRFYWFLICVLCVYDLLRNITTADTATPPTISVCVYINGKISSFFFYNNFFSSLFTLRAIRQLLSFLWMAYVRLINCGFLFISYFFSALAVSFQVLYDLMSLLFRAREK